MNSSSPQVQIENEFKFHTREMHTNSTEGCHLLTQKRQLCPGKPNFKPGPILVDEFIHLHLESHFLTQLKLRILLFPNLHNGFNTCPVFLGKNTLLRDSREILFAKDCHITARAVKLSPTFFYKRDSSREKKKHAYCCGGSQSSLRIFVCPSFREGVL